MIPIIGDLIQSLVAPVGKIIDDVVMEPITKLQIQKELFLAQTQLYQKMMEQDQALNDAQSKIIIAEASSDSWLTKSWRPILMLVFTGLVVARWFGLSANIPQDIELELWTIIKIGVGGYVAGRSLEKIAGPIADALKS